VADDVVCADAVIPAGAHPATRGSARIQVGTIRGKNFTRKQMDSGGTIPLTVEIEKARGMCAFLRSSFRQELVLVDDGRHRHFTVCARIVQAHDLALAMNANTLGQGNLRRQGQRELNRRPGRDGCVHIK